MALYFAFALVLSFSGLYICKLCRIRPYPTAYIFGAANMLLWAVAFLACPVGNWLTLGINAAASTVLLCIFFTDLYEGLIYNRFVIALFVLGIVSFVCEPQPQKLLGLIPGVFTAVLYFGFLLLHKKEKLGFGDVKMLLAAGLLLGGRGAVLAVILASLSFALLVLTCRIDKDTAVPFGPFIAVGTYIGLVFGPYIVDSYLSLFG